MAQKSISLIPAQQPFVAKKSADLEILFFTIFILFTFFRPAPYKFTSVLPWTNFS
jgi:hypothetical protein